MERIDPQNTALRWGVGAFPRQAYDEIMSCLANHILLLSCESSTSKHPNISPILIQLNPNSRNSSNISPLMSKRGLPGVSFSSCPEAKQFSATVSGVTGLIAM